jgi:hypothetical protein
MGTIEGPRSGAAVVTDADRRTLRELADTLDQLIATCNAGVERLRANRNELTNAGRGGSDATTHRGLCRRARTPAP